MTEQQDTAGTAHTRTHTPHRQLGLPATEAQRAPLTVPYTGQLRQMRSPVWSLYSEMHLLPTCWCLRANHAGHQQTLDPQRLS